MYEEIVTLARPYYLKGRIGDPEHIKWLKSKLFDLENTIKKRKYDFDIIFALTILHDVGYSRLSKKSKSDPFNLKVRKLHSAESAKIAKSILEKVNFPPSKMEKTLRLIKHHDDWAFGRPPKDPEWRVFTDLDFSWEASKIGFDVVRKFLNQTRKEFLKTVQRHYEINQKTCPFFLDESKRLFLQDLRSWKRKLHK